MNHLRDESSLYLRLHADNPVDWYPWCDEAFERARREDKPVFLSIGYSTCHWCHVMARESFADDEVARLMNRIFIAVKVDREERPDIDRLYMNVCQLMTGSGGWPLTILLTPDKRPFFAGTYLPKRTRFGRMGMVEMCAEISGIWQRRRDEIDRASAKIMSLAGAADAEGTGARPDEALLAAAWRQLSGIHDARHGGFGTAPKFPTPHLILFLLRWWRRTGDEHALAMATQTLSAMRRGGICDHIGFGFHRYATDEAWRVPHFEKMIYDQAMISLANIEAFQATGSSEFAQTAREIFAYVKESMTSPDGAFFTAEDAESEGEEGRFYIWREEELRTVLGSDDGAFACTVFNARREGNFSDEATGTAQGGNILYLAQAPEAIAKALGMPLPYFASRLEAVRAKLFAAREKRIRPRRDEKILTDWNGLMIASLARASGALGDPSYGRAAERAAHAIFAQMEDGKGGLFHCMRKNEGIPGNLDDYAFLAWGLIELCQATGDAAYLSHALELTDAMRRRFEAPEGGFFFTEKSGDAGFVRPKDAYDGAVPSGNSIAAWNLVRLGLMTGNSGLAECADRAFTAFAGEAERSPAGYTQFLIALALALGPSFEIVIAGNGGSPDTETMRAFLNARFLPEASVLFHPAGGDASLIESLAPFTKGMDMKEGRATAYVCSRGACGLPVMDPREMAPLLDTSPPRKGAGGKKP